MAGAATKGEFRDWALPGSPPRAIVENPESGRRLGPLDVLVFSAWCGLAGGELEVASRVLHKSFSPTNQLYGMTRHFVWVVPLVDLSLFLGVGLFWAAATRLWPRRAGWLGPRLIGALAILPALLVAGPRVYIIAWAIFALGIASWLAPVLERHAAGMRRRLLWSFPVVLGIVLVQAGATIGEDQLARWREGPSLAPTRFAQRAADRAGHGAGGSPEPPRL